MKYSATIEIYGKPAEQTMELATDFIKENKEVSIEQAVNLVVWQGYKEYLNFLSILKHYPRNENIYAKIHGDSIQIIPNYSLNDFHKNIIHLFDQFFKQHITESTHNDIMNAIKIILGLNKKSDGRIAAKHRTFNCTLKRITARETTGINSRYRTSHKGYR